MDWASAPVPSESTFEVDACICLPFPDLSLIRKASFHKDDFTCSGEASIRPYRSFDNSALRTLGVSSGTNGIAAHRRWDNKSLRVVDNKGIEFVAQAFHYRFPSFHQIQHIHCPLRIMQRPVSEPGSASFNELEFVEPGAFFCPSGTFVNELNTVDEALSHPLRLPVPSDVCHAVIEMDRARQTR